MKINWKGNKRYYEEHTKHMGQDVPSKYTWPDEFWEHEQVMMCIVMPISLITILLSLFLIWYIAL